MILASSKYGIGKVRDTVTIMAILFYWLWCSFMSAREKRFLYDIVANGRSDIDVDKLMESMRVMGDDICYRAKEYLTVHTLFATRADLHRTVYTHAKVKALELMVVDAMVSANSYLQIASHIQDPSQYWKYCNEFAVPKDKLENFKNVTAQDIVCSQKSGGVSIREEDVAVTNVRIDLTRGKHNPLDSVKFFQDYESTEKFIIFDDRISHLLPTSYRDMIVRVYSKKPELVGAISDAFENFQLKTYGVKNRCSCWHSRNARLASAIARVEFMRGEHDGGVAIAAWPMHSDQPSNAALVADVLKTEIVVREWKDRTGVVKASLIESVVRRFMASEEGCRIKETAEKLGAAVREATEAGGVSRIELDSFIAHVIR
ncbi:hypothetical protein SASPL_143215 [Salvia splendens]|uniref:Cis-zeatin O-glucosyltransferase n=1 Tax=Salvia splendens TaxID=180675 RepID=A0A8X8WM97_SALSN|nr:hypothetical protein SASPL_143215 [Salvia splendens]